MNISQIGLDLDQLAQTVASMQNHVTSMPEPADMRQVDGGNTEPGEQNFTTRLQQVANTLATRISAVRQFVTTNADALNAAAAALQNTDSAGTTTAATLTNTVTAVEQSTVDTTLTSEKATTFIDDIAGGSDDSGAASTDVDASRGAGSGGL